MQKIKDLLDAIVFEWDEGNITKNWNKHKVKWNEAEIIFFNEPLLIVLDKIHSTVNEQRYYALGKTKKNRKLAMVFTIRNKKIRIIMAWDQSKKERKIYDKT